MTNETVLVTGGNGFLGAYCALALLGSGYRVRTTIRNVRNAPRLLEMLRAGGAHDADSVDVVAADLTKDAGWREAVAGCRYVLHVASPYPSRRPRDENDLIVPARDGSLRVLRAARDAGVERVVLTSSFAAIGYGHPKEAAHTFTEADWTDPDAPGVEAYQRSKTLAERAAWDFVATDGGGLELAVVNPVGIIGPLLYPEPTTSMQLMTQLLNGQLPAVPRLTYGVVDVRDAADLHVRAMTNPAANGQRFLATAGEALWVADVARILRDNLGAAGRRVPRRVMPDIVVRALGLVVPSVRSMVHDLGVFKGLSNAKAHDVLGWRPRSVEQTLLEMAQSLVDLGLVKSS
ncbi:MULTISPECIES: SDR family oxidoreductase [unclassified Curtobacterium]|uniref:SDR family oxidoreductase n=1 Tax=unclassified Curtobacterium TaxID=257496 RepID=UPI0038216E96